MDPTLIAALEALAGFLGYKSGTPGMAAAGPAIPGTTPSPGQPGGPAVGGASAGFDPSKLLNLVLALSGGYYGADQLRMMQRIQQMQQQAAALAMNPAALAKRMAAATPKINQQLAYGVTSAADAATGGRGMAQAPGAVAAGETAALAPYAERNLEIGKELATMGPQYVMELGTPNYLSVLRELSQLGQSQTLPPYLQERI